MTFTDTNGIIVQDQGKDLKDTPVSSIHMGDSTAFAQVFRKYYDPLCRFAQRYVNDMDIAADVIETLFVNLWQGAETFADDSHAKHFLYKAAYNACLNQLRSQKRCAAREDQFAREAGAFEEDYLHDLLREELLASIYREIDRLPSHYSRVIRLGYVDGLSNDAIASEMGLSIQTVKNYKVKAFSMLRKTLSYSALVFLPATELIAAIL